jgi:hypothetical protein
VSFHSRPFRTAEQHAADILAMRLLNLAEKHGDGCQCWGCVNDDLAPDMGDPHEPWLHDPGDRVFDWGDE